MIPSALCADPAAFAAGQAQPVHELLVNVITLSRATTHLPVRYKPLFQP